MRETLQGALDITAEYQPMIHGIAMALSRLQHIDADVLLAAGSPESWELLVVKRGFSIDESELIRIT